MIPRVLPIYLHALAEAVHGDHRRPEMSAAIALDDLPGIAMAEGRGWLRGRGGDGLPSTVCTAEALSLVCGTFAHVALDGLAG